MAIQCPRCNGQFNNLLKIDAGMKLRLQEIGNDEHILTDVCNNCYDQLRTAVSQGAQLMAEQSQKEQNKAQLWKSRIDFIKEARERMRAKSFSEAAVCYEKYLRAVEIVHGIEPGRLDPLIFNAPGKSSELTILCTVYWDLFKIYDISPKYIDRQRLVGDRLLSITPFSNVQGDLIKKAERFIRDAKNEDNAREFLFKIREATGATTCFIATASFGDAEDSNVLIFRAFRDKILLKSIWGHALIKTYYFLSPPIARCISKRNSRKSLMKKILRPIALHIASRFDLQS